ncbi:MAG: hypothetical protein FWE82_05495 [Defluviitaleaceae bacterium]|nr:hypothetical protein [Defluviitaleaceae bacterium]
MKSKSKKFMALIVSVFMLAALLPATAVAADGDVYRFSDYDNDQKAFFEDLAKAQPGETFIYNTMQYINSEIASSVVPAGVTLDVTAIHTFSIRQGTLDNYGTIKVCGGYQGASFEINGLEPSDFPVFNNYGIFYIYENEYPRCIVVVRNGGTINNYGTFTNATNMNVMPDGTVNNHGTFINERDLRIGADSVVNNHYIFIQNGTFSFYSNGIFNDYTDPCFFGHQFIDSPIIEDYIAPTCIGDGFAPTVCSVCGIAGDGYEIPKLDHVPANRITVKEPTRTEKGEWEIYCLTCGNLLECGEIDELGITGVTTNIDCFATITETAKNSKVWEVTFTVTVTLIDEDGEIVGTEVVLYVIYLDGNNSNLSGVYSFDDDHDLAGYKLVYDIKGNGSNIKTFGIIQS